MIQTKHQRLITAGNLSKQYKGADKKAVSDISFTLDGGEVLCLLGPNGAGKTTTIKMALGLVTPSAGTAHILTHNTNIEAQRLQANPHIGVILEGARNIYWRLSPLENLRYFGANRGFKKAEIDERAVPLLSELGLGDHIHEPISRFSQGMKQKVALANALIHDPDILILDEPTLGLDVDTGQKIEAMIRQLVKRGKGILLTTHHMPLAQRLANRILVIKAGETVAYDETQQLLKHFDTRNIVEIKVEGILSKTAQAQITKRYPSLIITPNNHATLLEWVEPEQTQIIALLQNLNELGYPVTSLNRREPDLEEVFLSLTRTPYLNGTHHATSRTEEDVFSG